MLKLCSADKSLKENRILYLAIEQASFGEISPHTTLHWQDTGLVSGKAGMLSHLITLVSYFLLHWLHERKNSCWNSEPSLCKLIHFHCYIWSTKEHLSKYTAADFQIIRCMYLPQLRVGVDPAVKLHNRKPQSLPEEGNHFNIPSRK